MPKMILKAKHGRRRRYAIISLIAVSLLFTVGVYASVTFTRSGSVSVQEPISIAPSTGFTFSGFPGDTFTQHYDIANAANHAITITETGTVTGCTPTDVSQTCNIADVTVSGASVSAVALTTTGLDITITVSQGAVVGNYAISLTFQR